MPPVCTPTDNGATDRFSDGCAEYARKPNTCGNFDMPGFNSMEMCCACGGGVTVSPPAPPPQVVPFPPPGSPPAAPPLQPGHVLLQGGEDLSFYAIDPTVQVIELEPEQLYNVTAPIRVGSGNVSITLRQLAPDGSKPAILEVDSEEEAFASVGAGGSLSLSGVSVVRSNRSLARRRRRLAAGFSDSAPLLENNGGFLNIVDCVLGSENAVVVNSSSGDVNISGSSISGMVCIAQGKGYLRDSSFADSSPLVMGADSAELLIGTGNSFNITETRDMEAIVQTDTTSDVTYICESTENCQFSTTKAAVLQSSDCLAGSAADADDSGRCRLCSPGTYTNLDNQAECLNCSGGFYQENAGQMACDPCPLGHECPNGSATPVQCAEGYYGDDTELSECKLCKGGRYCAAGSFKGLVCARGTYCPPGAGIATFCPLGRYGADEGLNSSLCSGPCDPGHYCLIGSTSRQSQACPAGTFNGSHGLTSIDECRECPTGTACPSGSIASIECAPGTVANTSGMEACVKCDAGKYQAESGQESCTICTAGSYCEVGATAPSRCPAGYYSESEGESDNATACTLCPVGAACPSGSAEATKCQPGSVQNLTGQEACRKCVAGTFQSSQGMQECDICTLGGYCLRGSSAPSPCRAGRFGNRTGLTNLHACDYCEPGGSCPLGSLAPVPCTPGSFASVDRYAEELAKETPLAVKLAKCELCEPGTYQSDEGQKECQPCEQGGYCEAGASAPALCPAGFYGFFGYKDDGTYTQLEPLANITECTRCEPGTQCPVGSTEQTPCAAGAYANESALTIADRHTCLKCPAGMFQNDVKSTQCKVCPVGGYCTEGAAAVRPCSEGSYNDREGQRNRNAGCKPTEPGSYAKTFSEVQTPCPPGTVTPTASTATCDTCLPGTYQDELGKTVCKLCEQGYYCNRTGASVAQPCTAGTYSQATDLTSADQCTPTAQGNYAPEGSPDQTPCSPGTVAPNARTVTCDNCAAGTYQDKKGKTECKPCEQGYWCAEGASAPLPCKAGTYSQATDLKKDNCTSTEPGYYASPGSTDQTLCGPGTVAPNASTGTCAKCAGGTFQDVEGMKECKPCVAAYYCPVGTSARLPCKEGTYNFNATNLDGDTRPCTLASPGSYAPTGSTFQTPCSPGTAAPNAGMGTCDKCAAGSFQRESNATTCEPCKAGYYCPLGAAASLPCDAGTHSGATDLPSALNCSLTDSGFYAPTGSKRQTPCPLGSYDPLLKGKPADPELEQCELCPAGKFAGKTNQTECTTCTMGNWCSEGSSAPTPCDKGKVGARLGLMTPDECDECYAGSWCSAGMNIKCPGGTYGELTGQLNQGASAC